MSYLILLLLFEVLTFGQGQQQVLLSLGTPGGGGGACGGNGFSACKTLTIQSGQVTGTLTNFTMLVSDTDATLKSTGNGGTVTDAQGDDIVFTSDSGCTTLLNWEPLESWNNSTGAIMTWVKLPSAANGTAIYRCSGKGAITTFQGGSIGSAWDSNYIVVLHMPDGSTLGLNDSTANANNFTNHSATATTGKLDGGAAFASSQYLSHGALGVSDFTMTFSAWWKSSTAGSAGLFQYAVSSTASGCDTTLGNINNNVASFSYCYPNSGGTGNQILDGSTAINDGNWHYIVGTMDGSNLHVYVDGVSDATPSSQTNTTYSPVANLNVGIDGNSTDNPFTGSLDEVRYSKVARSADWIAAEYNNQNSPGTFYSVT